MADTESRLVEVAYRYVSMFLLELWREEPTAIAHALLLLAQQAEREREEWLHRGERT